MEERPPSQPMEAWQETDDESARFMLSRRQGRELVVAPTWADAALSKEAMEEELWQELALEYIHDFLEKKEKAYGDNLKPTTKAQIILNAIEEAATSGHFNTEEVAMLLHGLVKLHISLSEHVPKMVKSIYQWLASVRRPEHRLAKSILPLAEEHPHDVVVTLLRCSPSCDRTAVVLWGVMFSDGETSKLVMNELVRVLEDWPLHRTSTADRDDTAVCSLAATRVLREILNMDTCVLAVKKHFPHLFLAVLFQISFSTQHTPEEVHAFWRECTCEDKEPHEPKRFAAYTMARLLARVDCLEQLAAFERGSGWELLISPEVHHLGLTLLAGELKTTSFELRLWILHAMKRRLSREEPRWKIAAMAFILEMLTCEDLKEQDDYIVRLLPRYLHSEDEMMLDLLLRGLLKMCDGRRRWDATVRLVAIQLYMDVMDFTEPIEKWYVRSEVQKCLIPLLCHLDDDVEEVAEAALKTLTFAAKFLKKKKLKRMLKARKKWRAAEYLAKESGRITKLYLNQGLRYLNSPHEFVRLAAVRFLGLLGRHMMDWREEKLQIICEALERMTDDASATISSLAVQNILILRAVERRRNSTFGKHTVYTQFHKAWQRMPSWLGSCWWC
ncbi:maestro heat-like repeat-containing protein family member 7 isoform X2 [Cygnus olor]|uniref:maestro heat-like repeat-containing protein family member 7 isoform X2 n=1 Tax=Cygnus olor TaxID=8869 RepID=UPI001ADDEE65|nr:maestro heat-like repeat-containing protein family member 7 isoform X2 [Cygnus olor]